MKPLTTTWQQFSVRYSSSRNFLSEKARISEYLQRLERATNPYQFASCFFPLVQLYFDGLIDEKERTSVKEKEQLGKNIWDWLYEKIRKQEYWPQPTSAEEHAWQEREKTLDMLLKVGKKFVSTLYRLEEVPLDPLKNELLSHTTPLLKWGSGKQGKYRNLIIGGSSILNIGRCFSQVSEEDTIDAVVYVASGALESALLIADIAETDEIIPVRFSCMYRNDSEIKIPSDVNEKEYIDRLTNKRIIIVEDIVLSGKSLSAVYWYVENNASPTKTCLAAVCGTAPQLKGKRCELLSSIEETCMICCVQNLTQ